MKKFLKQIIFILGGAAIISGLITGCSGQKGKENLNTEESAKGRYLETKIELPKGTDQILDVCTLENGILRMAAAGEEGADGIWESKNQGESWSKVFDYPKDAISGSGCYLSGAALSVGGDIFYIVEDDSEMKGEGYKEGELKLTYWSMDKDGNSCELPMTSLKDDNQDIFLNTFQFTDENKILGIDTQGKLYLVDIKNDKLIWTIQDSKERFESYGVMEDTLTAVTSSGVQLWELTTGKIMEKDSVLEEEILKDSQEGNYQGFNGQLSFEEGKDNKAMFYVNKKGIYTHILGGSIVEQLVDNSLTSLAMPGMRYLRMAVTKDNSFFVAAMDSENHYEMFRYTYSEEAASKPQTMVKAYSLRDSPELRQSVIKFQNKNPDIFISLEIGLDEQQGAISVSDALKTLNTEIMAGKGPDILLMDGLPVNSYIEKGLLADLSQIVKSVSKSEGILENIVKTNTKDNKYYAIPTRFSIPVIEGRADIVQGSTDLESLVSKVESIRKNQPDTQQILGDIPPVQLAAGIYDTCSPAWLKEDRTINQDALEEYYSLLKRLYEADAHESENYTETDNEGTRVNISDFLFDYAASQTLINIGEISSAKALAEISSADKKLGNSMYKSLAGQSKGVFVPRDVIGVSKKGENTEEALKFAEFLISNEVQSLSQGMGLPVNGMALKNVLNGETQGELIETIGGNLGEDLFLLDVKWPQKEEIAEFEALVSSLETMSETDGVLRETVLKCAEECLTGKLSVQEAAKNVVQKVNLYLAE